VSQAQAGNSLPPPPVKEAPVSISELASQPRAILRDFEQRGVSFQGPVVNDWSKGTNATDTSSSGFGRYSFDLSMTLDSENLLGYKGATGFVRLKQHRDEFGATGDGAAQLFSNIDGPSRTSLYELWLEQKLLSGKVRLKGGKIDANTEFAVVQSAGDFLNSSMGYSPTILDFASYPDPRLGVSAFLSPSTSNHVGVGVFSTGGKGVLSLIEPGHSWSLGSTELEGRAALGYWRRDGNIAGFDGNPSSVAQGLYGVFEQTVWRDPLPNQGERRLATFLQFGHADGHVNGMTHHLGGGAVLQAPIARRSQDSLGVAATWVRFSSQPEAGFDWQAELVLESYYKVAITRHIALVQDFQFLHHPGGLKANPDYPVITPRLVFSF
jgi:carbohydrate-selective porin OprB